MLCFDDCQWVAEDEALERLFARLGESNVGKRRMLIVAGRRTPACFDALGFDSLAGLVERDSLQLLTRQLADLDLNLSIRLHHLTDGNPQLLTLAVDALRGVEDRAAMVAELDHARFVHEFLLRQVHRDLTEPQREGMIALTLLDDGASVAAVEAVLGGKRMGPVLDELARRNLVKQSEELLHGRFDQHSIIRDFFRELPSKQERLTMHGRAGA